MRKILRNLLIISLILASWLCLPTHAESHHATRLGNPAILLEIVDIEDPIEVGKKMTYDIIITNQGAATGTNIRLVCALPSNQEFSSGMGITQIRAQEHTVTMDTLPTLDAKAVAAWGVVVKALREDDARFKVELRSD